MDTTPLPRIPTISSQRTPQSSQALSCPSQPNKTLTLNPSPHLKQPTPLLLPSPKPPSQLSIPLSYHHPKSSSQTVKPIIIPTITQDLIPTNRAHWLTSKLPAPCPGVSEQRQPLPQPTEQPPWPLSTQKFYSSSQAPRPLVGPCRPLVSSQISQKSKG